MITAKMIRIKQSFDDNKINNIPGIISQEFDKIQMDQRIKPGMNIAITVGSRGIKNIKEITFQIIKEARKRKANPFLIPAMGSHGGATAEGQRKILEGYGISEKTMGVPIRSTMEVVELGKLENGLAVYFDKNAFYADGVIVVNRIKVHTLFKATVESGLCKMLSVGLGKQKGASLVHYLGIEGLENYLIKFAELILRKTRIICGIGILEDAYDNTYKITAALPKDFLKVDMKFLRESKKIIPRLPTSEIDILIIQEMGKNISGPGIDTNIIGGIKSENVSNPPNIKRILVNDLTTETHGNAMGVGMADIITRKLYNKIDFNSTYQNTVTTTFLERSRIPMVVENEKKALEILLKTIWNLPGISPRIIIIKNTLKLDEMYVSEAIWKEIKAKTNISPLGNWKKLDFDINGNLKLII